MKAFSTLRAGLPGWWVVGDFLGWWIAELRAAVAYLMAAARFGESTRVFLYVEATKAIVRQVRRSRSEDIGVLVRNIDGQLSTNIEAGESSQEVLQFAGSSVTVILPAADVLVRELTLPAAAESALDRVLAIQTVREFPLAVAQLQFDHCVAQRLRDTKQIVVHLRAVRRSQINDLSNWALGAGARISRVCYQTADGELAGNFLPRASKGGGTRLSRLERGLAVAVLSLLVTLATVVGGQWWFEHRQIDAELIKTHAQAQHVRMQWKQIETESAPGAELVRIMTAPDATTVLSDLPDRLPTDTWVSQIEISAPVTTASLSLSAFAPAATTLVDQLGRDAHFKHVHLIYAANDSFSNHGDRVQLSAEWIAPKGASNPLAGQMLPPGVAP